MKSIYKGICIAVAIALTNQISAQKGPAHYGVDTSKHIPMGLAVGVKVQNMKMRAIDGTPEFTLKSMYEKGPVVVYSTEENGVQYVINISLG